ncbi:centrosomal protein of 95 kDa [Ascaphus truei]|uniref:centrosomal protein of 95 kDa n=1 Tax=Ascaphus truei TaxID=8439 RepID=UPI003F595DDD
MGSEDKGWVSVANNLLGKCHVNRQVRDVTDCDARIFVSLYEAILGEKVPDFIAEARNQEDDTHNVQSVIDSLALDYLQVSLSHITGENVVRGDGESIGNLLEIFDGLLEYLTEQISEASSQNGDDLDHVMDFHQRVQHAEITGGEKDVLPTLRPAPSAGSSQPSSDLFVPSWEVDGSESTAELIRLGETAHTFTIRGSDLKQSRLFQKGETSVTPRPEVLADRKLSESAPGASRLKEETPNERPLVANGFSTTRQLQEETPSAIPLQRPYQPKETRPVPSISTDWSSPTTPVRAKDHTASERANGPDPSWSTAVKNLPAGPSQDSTLEENLERRRLTSPARASLREEPRGIPVTAETLSAGHKKVAFRTLPDVRYMTLRSTLGGNDEWASGSEGEDTTVPDSVTLRLPDEEYPTVGSEGSLLDSRRSDTLQESLTEEPLSLRRARNKVSEQELQEMSEKLSRRLAELDHMLKAAIGEQGAEPRDEDKLSQHSDSIMEFRRKKQLQGGLASCVPPEPRGAGNIITSCVIPVTPRGRQTLKNPRVSTFTQKHSTSSVEISGHIGCPGKRDVCRPMGSSDKDTFSMLAEAVTDERHEIQAREKAQAKALHKMKRELRAKMEREIQDLQEMIIKTDEDAFFRELEAEQLKRRIQMASFQYGKSHVPRS